MITIDTKRLCDFLADLIETADHRGIHLQSVRGYDGDEPGEVSLLVGTSTDGYVLGHTWIPREGSLPGSMWPISDAKAVIAVCKPLAASHKNHTVNLTLSGATLLMQETPELFDAGTELHFETADVDDSIPVRAKRILSGDPLPLPVDPEGEPRLDTARTSFSHIALEPLIKIAKRRGEAMHLFRSHSAQLHRVQIGSAWLGAIAPSTAHDHDDPDKPNETAHFGDSVITDKVSSDDTDWLTKVGALWPLREKSDDPDSDVDVDEQRPGLFDGGDPDSEA